MSSPAAGEPAVPASTAAPASAPASTPAPAPAPASAPAPDASSGAPPGSGSGAVPPGEGSGPATLGSATYEIIRHRLHAQGAEVRTRMARLNTRRQEVFGTFESKILKADRVTTAHNCIPRDMVKLGESRFLFGFNVQFGLKKEIDLGDVFAIFDRDEAAGTFREADLGALQDSRFLTDFKRLYNVYEKTVFTKFFELEGRLYMVFRIGTGPQDISVFKWTFESDGSLRFVDGRAEAEFRRVGFPPAHQFRWLAPTRASFRYGDHPHVSIEDRVFVECVGGDLTIKVEDNTATGEGIYSEPVEDRYQKVDDAEIAYALVDPLILLKVRPYKETLPRHFIFNEKLQTVDRVDSIGESCALLPEDHGLIFPDGYYLATGELKRFESREPQLTLERAIHAHNGEDSLFVFYSALAGIYVLMHYRLIAQKVEERIVCHGFSLFPNGQLLLFRADELPQKHHTVQLRQTPFHEKGYEPPGQRDAFLYHIGNKEVVRCLAECNEILTLIARDNPYAELYADLVKRCDVLLDAYPWLAGDEGFGIHEAVRQVRETSDQAVEEFDKVRRLQRDAVRQVSALRQRCEEQFGAARRASFARLEDYVRILSALRRLRGELISLREVRYVDATAVAELEKSVVAQNDELSAGCVRFLLKPESIEPYRQRAQEQLAAVETVTKVAEGRKIEQAAAETAAELEMLIEIVHSLRIEDATETTRIIDGITAIYATLNQVKAALHKRLQELVAAEGAAQFDAQMKLLGQSAASLLDLCDSPAKCDESLNRVTVQIEELEGTFADFEQFTVPLAERRAQLYEAFEQRKVALVEQQNRRAGALMTAAERVLKVVQNRLAGFRTVDEIHSYIASDLMVAKVRETIAQLLTLGDPVKADDLQGRLKAAQQDAVRQLRDRQDLFVGGDNVIQFGRHRFNINTQPLDLTTVHRDGAQYIHLTSTKYFDEITEPGFLAARDLWDQEVISENHDVYRAEYLAYRLLKAIQDPSAARHSNAGAPAAGSRSGEAGAEAKPLPGIADILASSEEARLSLVREFMATRYQEGYTRGIHDLDGAAIFSALIETHAQLGLARYPPNARACALVYWLRYCPPETRDVWTAQLRGFADRNRLFPGDPVQQTHIAALTTLVARHLEHTHLHAVDDAPAAGEYLFHQLTSTSTSTPTPASASASAGASAFVVSREAETIVADFRQYLVAKGAEQTFAQRRQALAIHPAAELELIRDWLNGFLLTRPDDRRHLEEAAAILFCGDAMATQVVQAPASRVLEGLKGVHPRIESPGNRYRLDYLDFMRRLGRFDTETVPRFEAFRKLKQQLLDEERKRLRLEEFKPRVLTSFVRNQLVDQVYLPLIGDNLAKQIGAAGDQKRTDLMGMLLLISPPGYGKTTLMEYVASRLGIVFVKINGPALGHQVTSLDPAEAPNAAARDEIHKLNLALEMGDNTMLCIDDIQHCHPEFLQKFISLCDAQRRMEGVWRGQSRTYDLRGRKVVVVMAGNPYTESGQQFKIPDMLANRADTYNLGDIIGGRDEWFKASYLENAITSNPVLAPLAGKSQKDVRAFIRIAASGEESAEAFEGSYGTHEVEEILAVLRRLVTIREVVLRVNQEYIRSAAQSDDYRTEPPFRLQGSYRNMNRLAERVVPIMNDAEIRRLLLDHYRNESQTLTTGAEANLLKFKELVGALTPEEAARWEEIKRTFRRNVLVRGGDERDPLGRVVGQLSAFQAGLEGIQQALQSRSEAPPPSVDLAPVVASLDALQASFKREPVPSGNGPSLSVAAQGVAERLAQEIRGLGQELARALTVAPAESRQDRLASVTHELEMIHSTLATLKDLAGQQRDHLRTAQELLAARAKQGTVEFELTQEMLSNERAFLERFHQVLADAQRNPLTSPVDPIGPTNATSPGGASEPDPGTTSKEEQ